VAPRHSRRFERRESERSVERGGDPSIQEHADGLKMSGKESACLVVRLLSWRGVLFCPTEMRQD